MMIIHFSPLMDLSLSRSMFSQQQQASPQFSQQSGGNMYNGNGMNLNSVSMAPNLATSSMGQMAGQMSVTSMPSGPSPGLPAMGQEQVSTDVVDGGQDFPPKKINLNGKKFSLLVLKRHACPQSRPLSGRS